MLRKAYAEVVLDTRTKEKASYLLVSCQDQELVKKVRQALADHTPEVVSMRSLPSVLCI
jgi:hypothetical protein